MRVATAAALLLLASCAPLAGSQTNGAAPPVDCTASSTLITERCCDAPSVSCTAGTPARCTPGCSPSFIDFWLSACHDSLTSVGATFQADLDALMDQCASAAGLCADPLSASGQCPSPASAAPEMVHLSVAGVRRPDSVVVTWQTSFPQLASEVGFQAVDQPGAGWIWSTAPRPPTMAQMLPGMPSTQPSSYQTFGYQSGNVHRVTMTGLTPGVRYRYRVGDRRPQSALAVGALSEE